MVKKQSILCKCHFIINILLTHVTHMRNVCNGHYTMVCIYAYALKKGKQSDYIITHFKLFPGKIVLKIC